MESTAQQLSIINEIVRRMRHSNDLSEVLQFAIDSLTATYKADRGLIWLVVGDQLTVTHESVVDSDRSVTSGMLGLQLDWQESTTLVLEYLCRVPYEEGVGIIEVADIETDTTMDRSPTLRSALERSKANARLLMQIRSRGIFSGFVELQQCQPRVWSEEDSSTLQTVVNLVSTIVQQSSDQYNIAMDAKEMKLLLEIAHVFRESCGLQTSESIVRSVRMIAEFMHFAHAQAFIVKGESLMPLIDDGKSLPLELSAAGNPFVDTYQILNQPSWENFFNFFNTEPPIEPDPFFGGDLALLLPVTSKGERLGVIGFWKRLPNGPLLRPLRAHLALTFTGHLADAIAADRRISQLRGDVSEHSD